MHMITSPLIKSGAPPRSNDRTSPEKPDNLINLNFVGLLSILILLIVVNVWSFYLLYEPNSN